jgi:hypothetical protein
MGMLSTCAMKAFDEMESCSIRQIAAQDHCREWNGF